MQNEPLEVTFKVTNLFEKLGVPYLISGSLASTLHGMVRTTKDSDIVAEMMNSMSATCWSVPCSKQTSSYNRLVMPELFLLKNLIGPGAGILSPTCVIRCACQELDMSYPAGRRTVLPSQCIPSTRSSAARLGRNRSVGRFAPRG